MEDGRCMMYDGRWEMGEGRGEMGLFFGCRFRVICRFLPSQSYHFSLCDDFSCVYEKKAVTLQRNLVIAAFAMQVCGA